ncbi:hypothetical protein [Nocardia niwae]|uniref:Uncharacterized protein n=1 Tax=Nocardia niwae TaxID=626084 RepID=A0ABV2X826_9NOCA|nr:hypothetical protein [Nocardia niwae]
MGIFGRRRPERELISGLDHHYVRLADPGLPEDEPIQMIYTAIADTGLSELVFGPGTAAACYAALAAVAPVFATTVTKTGVFGSFPHQYDILWYALEGPLGSAIVVSFGPESDDDFRRLSIDGPLSRTALRPPFRWGSVLGLGASVPSGFAEVFPTASLRPLSTLPGLEHL